jgi:hypothetical protein
LVFLLFVSTIIKTTIKTETKTLKPILEKKVVLAVIISKSFKTLPIEKSKKKLKIKLAKKIDIKDARIFSFFIFFIIHLPPMIPE